MILLIMGVPGLCQLSAQSANPNSPIRLEKIERDTIQKLSAMQKAKWGRADHFESSKIARRIACSLAANDATYSDSVVVDSNGEGDFSRPSSLVLYDSRTLAVGTWFAATRNHPEGAYWVVIRPLPTKNPFFYMASIFTDCPLLRCTRFDGEYPVTSACESEIH